MRGSPGWKAGFFSRREIGRASGTGTARYSGCRRPPAPTEPVWRSGIRHTAFAWQRSCRPTLSGCQDVFTPGVAVGCKKISVILSVCFSPKETLRFASWEAAFGTQRTLRYSRWAAEIDPKRTLVPASDHSRSGHFVRLHALIMFLLPQMPELETYQNP